MKLLSVDIENFMALGRATISLADRGLVLIQGENEDDSSAISNGAGKSSIADAVCWCLYGATSREEDGDNVVNIAAGKGTAVAVDIEEKPGETYRIARYRKHKTYKNSLRVTLIDAAAGTSTDLTKGTDKLTQEVVTAIMGCSLDVFWGAIYAGQERMPDIPGMTDKQLKMLIEEASGATLLEAAYAEANKRVQMRKTTLAAAELGVTQAIEREKEAIANVATVHASRDAFERRRVEAVREIASDAKRDKDGIVRIEAEIAAHPRKDHLKSQIANIDDLIASVGAELIEDRRHSEGVEGSARDLVKAQQAYSQTERTMTSYFDKMVGLDHKVGCPCDTCDRPFSAEDIGPAKKLLAATIEEAKAAQVLASHRLTNAHKLAASYVSVRDEYRATMTDLSAASAERASLVSEVDVVTDLENDLKNAKNDLATAIRSIKTKRDEINPFIEHIVQAENDVVATALRTKTAADLQISYEADLKVHTLAAQVFSPSGVRALLLDDVTPFLNDQTAKYLGTLSDGNISATWTTLVKNAKGELREKFSVEIATTTGGATFKSVSGGEKRKVRIACALALQDLVARRASKPIELFIGDEIDDALDPAGLQRLAEILEEKARERGSVFIISHNDLKDFVRNTITVRKSGGKATVEECTS